MTKTLKLALPLICLALFADTAFAQVPGDGIPDVYEVTPGGETFLTTAGEITRPAGTIVVDTDGSDMVAILIEGANIVTNAPDNGDYLTGATEFLPDPLAPPPLFSSNWTSGYISGLNQWIRTNPLDTDGFLGVVGVHDDDPFAIFPNLGLGTIDAISGISKETLVGANVVFQTHAMGGFSTVDGTMGPVFSTVPEPTTMSLVGLTLLGRLGRRRRS